MINILLGILIIYLIGILSLIVWVLYDLRGEEDEDVILLAISGTLFWPLIPIQLIFFRDKG